MRSEKNNVSKITQQTKIPKFVAWKDGEFDAKVMYEEYANF